MATQRVLLTTLGGALAENVGSDICRWSDSRVVQSATEWSPDDWPTDVRREIDAFISKLAATAFLPPVLYRSEHVDCWSMGDVLQGAIKRVNCDSFRQVLTMEHELFATWIPSSDEIVPDGLFADETRWLYSRINEATAAWGEFTDRRLLILIRMVLGGLVTDEEVSDSLPTLPAWWTENR